MVVGSPGLPDPLLLIRIAFQDSEVGMVEKFNGKMNGLARIVVTSPFRASSRCFKFA